MPKPPRNFRRAWEVNRGLKEYREWLERESYGVKLLTPLLEKSARILDVGCGCGKAVGELRKMGKDAIGITLHPPKELGCREHPYYVLVGDFLEWKPERPFQLALDVMGAYTYVEEKERYFHHLLEVLEEGGSALVLASSIKDLKGALKARDSLEAKMLILGVGPWLVALKKA